MYICIELEFVVSQVETNALSHKVVDCSPEEFQNLADWGRKEITLAENEMPGLMALRKNMVRQNR